MTIEVSRSKRCSQCSLRLPLTKFGKASANKDGLSNRCKDCRRAGTSMSRSGGVLTRAALVGEVCAHPKCGTDLVGEVFPSRLRLGLVYCTSEHRQQDQARLKQQRRRTQLPTEDRWKKIWKRFGLTEEQWLTLLEKQGGKCRICGTKDPKQWGAYFHTDHTEERGFIEVRGLLCSSCNQGLGYFHDDPELLQAAIDYLLFWRNE